MVELYQNHRFVRVDGAIANRTPLGTTPTLLENAKPQTRPITFNGLGLGKDNESTLFYNVREALPLTLENDLLTILAKCEQFNITVVKNRKGYKFYIYDTDYDNEPPKILKTYCLADLTKKWCFVEYYLPVEKYSLKMILENDNHELAIKYLTERQVNLLSNGF